LGGGRCSSLPQVSACLTTGTGQRFDPETETLIPTIGGGFDVAHTLRGEGFDASEDGTGRGTPLVPVAFSCKDHGADAGELSPTLRAMGHGASHANAGGQVAVAFAHQAGGAQTTLGYDASLGTAPTLAKCQTPAVHAGMAVRRLTPRECERLQAAPDDWTLVPNDRGKPMADGPRYRMCGNSFTATVIRWIGRRVEMAHTYENEMKEAA